MGSRAMIHRRPDVTTTLTRCGQLRLRTPADRLRREGPEEPGGVGRISGRAAAAPAAPEALWGASCGLGGRGLLPPRSAGCPSPGGTPASR